MTRTRRTDWVLLAVAMILLGVWFAFPRSRAQDELLAADWSDFSTDPPRRITLRRGTSRLVLLYRPDAASNERYVTQAEHGAHTDPAVVDRLLLALGRLELVRRVDARAGELGLDPPLLQLELETRTGRRAIALGNQAPSPRSARYALVEQGNDRQLVVLAKASTQALDIAPEDLLDHRVFDFVPSEVRGLTWSTPNGPLGILRTDDGHWALGSTPGQRIRRATVTRLLSALSELKLSKHVSPSVAEATLRATEGVKLDIQIRREERQLTYHLRTGGACPGTQAELGLMLDGTRRVSGCIEREALTSIVPAAPELVDDALFSLHGDEVEQLALTSPTRHFSLTRDGAEFRVQGHPEIKAPLAAGNGLMDSVVSIHGTLGGPCDFDAANGRTVLKLDSYLLGDVKTVERVKFSASRQDGTRVVCRDDGTELTLTAMSARLLDLSEELLREQTLLDVPIEAVREIRVQSEHSRPVSLGENTERRFVLLEPRDRAIPPVTIERLREQLASLRAARWLLAAEPQAFGTERPSLTLDLDLRPEDADAGTKVPVVHRRLRVVLDERDALGFGWLDRDPMPFVLEAALVRELLQVSATSPRPTSSTEQSP